MKTRSASGWTSRVRPTCARSSGSSATSSRRACERRRLRRCTNRSRQKPGPTFARAAACAGESAPASRRRCASEVRAIDNAQPISEARLMEDDCRPLVDARSLLGVHSRGVRRPGFDPGGGGSLRSRGVLRDAAHERDRRSHGARRRAPRHSASRRRPEPADGADRPRPGAGRRRRRCQAS